MPCLKLISGYKKDGGAYISREEQACGVTSKIPSTCFLKHGNYQSCLDMAGLLLIVKLKLTSHLFTEWTITINSSHKFQRDCLGITQIQSVDLIWKWTSHFLAVSFSINTTSWVVNILSQTGWVLAHWRKIIIYILWLFAVSMHICFDIFI